VTVVLENENESVPGCGLMNKLTALTTEGDCWNVSPNPMSPKSTATPPPK
jgi:hypothetical protein